MKVEVYSREHVRQLDPRPDTCLISIWSLIALAACEYKDVDVPMDGWYASLRLNFDDVTHTLPIGGMIVVPFDEAMGSQVLDFIEGNLERNFVIHCDAGMSRSVAVASVMAMLYGYDPVYHETGHDGMRNILVVNTLRREWINRHAEIDHGSK